MVHSPSSVTKTMVDYVVQIEFNDLHEKAIEKAKFLILDAIGCGLGGVTSDLGKKAIKLCTEANSPNGSTIFGTPFKQASTDAAYINAILVNALDYDDTGGAGHPGATIIPAALAVAETLDVTGKELLTVIICGYELCEKIGKAIQPTWERYVKVHGQSHQVFGAVTAAGKLMGFDETQFLNALGIAGAFAPVPHAGKFGLVERPITWIKDNVAWSSHAGVFAANLANKGFIGSKTILDGDKGFWVMVGSDRCDFDKLLDFESPEILRVSFKPYPCCRWIHTTLDAVETLLSKHNFKENDVKELTVKTISPLVRTFMDTSPLNMVDAEFSLPYAVAIVLKKVPHPIWYSKDVLFNSQNLKLMGRIKAKIEPEAEESYITNRRIYYADHIPSTVEVVLTNGLKVETHAKFAKGSPWNELTPEDIIKKYKELAAVCVNDEKSKQILNSIMTLENVDSGSLIQLLRNQ